MITQIDPFSEPIFLGDGGQCPPYGSNAMHAPCPWAGFDARDGGQCPLYGPLS
jgi:hypothetical protein